MPKVSLNNDNKPLVSKYNAGFNLYIDSSVKNIIKYKKQVNNKNKTTSVR